MPDLMQWAFVGAVDYPGWVAVGVQRHTFTSLTLLLVVLMIGTGSLFGQSGQK